MISLMGLTVAAVSLVGCQGSVASGLRALGLAALLAGCSSSFSSSGSPPVCTPSCPSSQVCMTVCVDGGGANPSECLVSKGGDVYTTPDGRPAYVSAGF